MTDMSFDEMPDGRLFMGGEWRAGTGAEITSVFPADGSVNRVLRGASRADGTEAIARAKAAQADPAWRGLKPHERARYLYAIADGIEANIQRISRIQSRDTGKTQRETAALAASAAGTFRYFGAVAETMDEDLTAQRGDSLTLSVHEPLGLVAAITPWNSPIASDAQKVAPALAAGNAVILKPASWSPLTALELARIVEATGLPKGLFSVLPGAGREIGNLLVEHPDIAKVSFTGGTSTGRALARKAAEKLMPVSLELGGKSPTMLFGDADMEQALAGILFGIFSSSGQSCIAGSRLFVQRGIYDEVVARLVAATKRLKVGHPFDPATQVAPLVHMDHRDEVAAHVARALEDGAELLCGGAVPEGEEYANGSYYLPTILTGVKNTDRICRDEVFGPVLAVLPFEDEADVIAQSNDSDYGLACGIWTRDFPKAWRVGRAVNAGTIWHNTYKQFSISTPFGGERDSGTGREKGRQGLRAYMTQKSFYSDLSGAPHPWAGAALEEA
ncbi:MAG: aldehyde dehydrogenase [Antarcticimicrobium sp.]|uniref:aldehyde dehydrogenase n=1 Tax=Antarcticimicrobium sp. TaxID=2824147 RepID=UPI00261B3EE1|nr:aldehyde dehydrogenase [Antarcticimicrobium sp.]MDF1716990.1 aldehyde dehydrogenase [Antarcticimicrobium sp.]